MTRRKTIFSPEDKIQHNRDNSFRWKLLHIDKIPEELINDEMKKRRDKIKFKKEKLELIKDIKLLLLKIKEIDDLTILEKMKNDLNIKFLL